MIKDFVSDLKSGRISRREANRKLATLGLGLVTLPMLQRPARAENDIIYFTWEGYEIPELQAAYLAKYGEVAPNAIFASEEEALSKLRAGFEATLAHPCTYSLTRWKDAGVIQPLDTSRLKNYPDLYEGLRTLPGAQMDGQTYFVPFDWGNSSVVYRTDMFPEGTEESWGMLYDERIAGKIGMSSDAETNVEVAALVLGHKNIFSLSDAQLAEVRPLMVKQKKLLRFYWDSQTTMEQAMAAGEVAAAYAWNSSYTNLKNQGIPVAYANPKEGIFTWCCGLTMLTNPVGDINAAYELIDAMIAPESGKYLIEAYSYGHSNKKAFEIADPVAIDALGMRNPDELFSTGIFFEPLPDEYSVKYVEMFTEIQAG